MIYGGSGATDWNVWRLGYDRMTFAEQQDFFPVEEPDLEDLVEVLTGRLWRRS